MQVNQTNLFNSILSGYESTKRNAQVMSVRLIDDVETEDMAVAVVVSREGSDVKIGQKESKIESKAESESAASAKIIGSININDEQAEKLEKALTNTDLSALIKEAQELNDDLEVNWNAVVDPDGAIYARAYVESLATQYENAKNTIEQYYASAHKDNLAQGSEAAAMNYLTLKYTKLGFELDSPYYRSDMSEAERQMALRQERALLLGGRVTLGDPYALQSSGGMLNM